MLDELNHSRNNIYLDQTRNYMLIDVRDIREGPANIPDDLFT